MLKEYSEDHVTEVVSGIEWTQMRAMGPPSSWVLKGYRGLGKKCQFSSVTQSCPILCNPMDSSIPGFPVHHQLTELAQTYVHWVGDANQPSNLLSSPSPAFSLSQHQGLSQWVSSSHQVAKVLGFQFHQDIFKYSGNNWRVLSRGLVWSNLHFSYCSWGTQGKNPEVVCHSLLQWTTFCQTSPPWPSHLGWPHTAWLNFMELDQAVVCVIRLASSLISVCLPSDDLSQHLLSYLGFSYLGRGVSLHGCSSKVQSLLLTLDEGYLLTAAPPDLERGVAPFGPPVPTQPPLLGCVVAPLSCCPWPPSQVSAVHEPWTSRCSSWF